MCLYAVVCFVCLGCVHVELNHWIWYEPYDADECKPPICFNTFFFLPKDFDLLVALHGSKDFHFMFAKPYKVINLRLPKAKFKLWNSVFPLNL